MLFGLTNLLKDIQTFKVSKLNAVRTSKPRGILILGNSGAGKSFAVRELINNLDGFGKD